MQEEDAVGTGVRLQCEGESQPQEAGQNPVSVRVCAKAEQ